MTKTVSAQQIRGYCQQLFSDTRLLEIHAR
jgi:hypothetical protein